MEKKTEGRIDRQTRSNQRADTPPAAHVAGEAHAGIPATQGEVFEKPAVRKGDTDRNTGMPDFVMALAGQVKGRPISWRFNGPGQVVIVFEDGRKMTFDRQDR